MSNDTKTPDKVERFDKKTVGLIGAMMWSMVQAFASTRGLTVKQERGKYTTDTYTWSVTFRTMTEAGAPGEFATAASRVGLPVDSWGKIFGSGGNRYKIVDIKTRNRKYPVIAEQVGTGKRYKFPVATVTMGLR
jgi:hypothetical protein